MRISNRFFLAAAVGGIALIGGSALAAAIPYGSTERLVNTAFHTSFSIQIDLCDPAAETFDVYLHNSTGIICGKGIIGSGVGAGGFPRAFAADCSEPNTDQFASLLVTLDCGGGTTQTVMVDVNFTNFQSGVVLDDVTVVKEDDDFLVKSEKDAKNDK